MTRDIDSPDYRDSNVGEGMIPPRKSPNAKPRAGEHTKGPWRVDDDFLSPLEWYADALICADGKFLAAAVTSPDGYKLVEAKANARRIVACVNACEGIETDDVETLAALKCAIPGVAGVAQMSINSSALEEERDTLAAQNRELVEALHGFLKHAYSEDTEQRVYWENNARATLSKVRT